MGSAINGVGELLDAGLTSLHVSIDGAGKSAKGAK